VGVLNCGKDVGVCEGMFALGESVIEWIGNVDGVINGDSEGEMLIVTGFKLGFLMGLERM